MMKTLLCRFGTIPIAVVVLSISLVISGTIALHTYASETPEERAKARYDELIERELLCIDDLADVWADEAWRYIEVAIPGAACWTQTQNPLPFNPTNFPKSFLDGLVGYYVGESNVPVYEVIVFSGSLRAGHLLSEQRLQEHLRDGLSIQRVL